MGNPPVDGRRAISGRRQPVVSLAVALITVGSACGTSLDVAPSGGDVVAAVTATPASTPLDTPDDPTAEPTATPAPTPVPDPTPTTPLPATPTPEPPTPMPDPTPTVADIPIGYQPVEVAGHYSLAVPEGWTVLSDPDDVEELLVAGGEIAGIDPAQLPLIVQQLAAPGTLMVLADDGDNVNILALPRFDPLEEDPDDYADLVLAQFGGAGGFDDLTVTAEYATLGENRGVLAEGSYGLGGVPLVFYQFLVEGRDHTYVVSVTVDPGDEAMATMILASLDLT